MRNFQFIQEFEKHSKYLNNFAMKLTKNKSKADDLYQDTALSALRHQNKFTPHTNFKAWLATIMKNSYINQYRKHKRRNEMQDNTADNFYLNTSEKTIPNTGEMNINIQEITKIIDSLDETYRIPFLMTYEGYQYEEIQRALGNIPIGTVKSRIHHARRILKNKIRKMYEDVAA